jgi:Na+-transporting NADH:ubiquinone oxidoreductase subunit D
MGRAETFASSNPPGLAFIDALGVGLGYGLSLIVLAVVRELLGFGTLMDVNILGDSWQPWVIMVMAPGAFLVLGLYIWILRGIQSKRA